MLRKFLILLQNILLDTLINPLDSSSIFKMNLVIMAPARLNKTQNLLSKAGKHQQYDDITNIDNNKTEKKYFYYHYK